MNAKRHYNETPATLETAARMFDAAGIDYDSRDHYALASDLNDVLASGETVETFVRNIGELGNLRSYVNAIRQNYFES